MNLLVRLFVIAFLSYSTVGYVAPFLPRSRTCSSGGLQPAFMFGNFFGSPTPSKAPSTEKESAVSDEVETTGSAKEEVAEAEEEVAPEATATDDESTEEAAAEETTEAAPEEASAAEDAPKPKRVINTPRHTIFVGNLPFDTKESELKGFFEEQGEVKKVSIPINRDNGMSRGFAFVDMGTPEEVEAAVGALDGSQFGGRTIRVTKSLPREEAQKQPKKVDAGLKKIYVGNIPFETKQEDLIEFFSEYGEVSNVYIPINPATGDARGFAFLSLPEEAADVAIDATNGLEFMGRRIAVSPPLPPGQKSQRRTPRTKLYVGNLSFYTTADTVRALFEEFGTVYDCYLPEDIESGGSRGFGFVTMDQEAAQGAIDEADGCELDGRIIRVNEAQPKFVKQEPEEGDDAEAEELGEP